MTGCYNTGNISSLYNSTGGLVGFSYGSSIDASYNAGNVVSGDSIYTGGLVGEFSEGSISNSYNTGNVSTNGSYTGGIIGYSYNGSIMNCYNTGNIHGNYMVGGLVGFSSQTISINNYVTGNISGNVMVGGLAGYMQMGNMEYCYFMRTATVNNAAPAVGAIAGVDMNDLYTFDGDGILFDIGSGLPAYVMISPLLAPADNLLDALNGYMWVLWYDDMGPLFFFTGSYGTDGSSAKARGILCAFTATPVKANGFGGISVTDWIYGDTASTVDTSSVPAAYPVPLIEYKVTGASDDTYTATVPSSSGLYTVRATFDPTEHYKGYTPTFDFEIMKATLTVTPDPGKQKIYGDDDPMFEYAVTGWKYHDEDDIGTIITGALSRYDADNQNVGMYLITIGSLTLHNDNYVFDLLEEYFEITRRQITVTADPGYQKAYGDKDPLFTYTITSGELVEGDAFSGTLSREPGEDAGMYMITQGTLTNDNYDITFIGAEFEILPAPSGSFIWLLAAFMLFSLLFFVLWCMERPRVSGRITYNGKGVAGATITYTLNGQTEQWVRTDDNGGYVMNVVRDSDLKITGVVKEGLALSEGIDMIRITDNGTELNMTMERK